MSTVMSTQPVISTPTFPGPSVLYRMNVDEYERIGEMLDDPRVELIDGYLVKKMPNWLVNLVDRHVEVYTDPGPAGYASRKDFPSGQQVPVVIDGRQAGQIAVDDILP